MSRASVPMFRGNAARTGEMPGPGPSGTPRVLWRFETELYSNCAPLVGHGMVYIGSVDNHVYAIDQQTGEQRWRLDIGNISANTPVLVGERLYVAGNDGFVSAIDAFAGEVVWRVSLGNSTYTEHVCSQGGRLYFHAAFYDYEKDETGDSFVFALDRATGREHWRHATASISAEVAVGDGVLVCGDRNGLQALDASTGASMWLHEGYVGNLAVIGDSVVSIGRVVNSVDLCSGAERWRYTLSRPTGPYLCSGDGYVFTATRVEEKLTLIDGRENPWTIRYQLLALDAETGLERWPGQAEHFWAPTTGRLVFGSGWEDVEERLVAEDDAPSTGLCPMSVDDIVFADGVVYVSSSVGEEGPFLIQAFAGQDGCEIWRFPAQFLARTLTVADGVIFVGADDGVYAIGSGTDAPLPVRSDAEMPVPTPANSSLEKSEKAGSEPAPAMFHGNPARTGVMSGPGPKGQPRELWRFKTGEEITSSPVLSDGVVYVGSHDNHIYAVDSVTGTEIDHFPTEYQIWSSPAIVSGALYVGSNDQHLYAIDIERRTGWRRDIGHAVVSSPVVVDGVVYVGSYDNAVYALDADNLLRVWRFETGAGVRSTPAVADGAVYIGSDDKHIYALDAKSGVERWRFATGGEVRSSPAVADGVVYAGSTAGNLYALDAADGRERWRYDTRGQILGSPAVDRGLVYIGTVHDDRYRARLLAVDAVTGEKRWGDSDIGSVQSSPTIAGGVLYVGSDDTHLYAFDAATGRQLWRFETGGAIVSSPSVVDGVVYIGSKDGHLYAVAGTSAPTPRAGSAEEKAFTAVREVPVIKGLTPGAVETFAGGAPTVGGALVLVGSADTRIHAVDAASGEARWRLGTGSRVWSTPAVDPASGRIVAGSHDGRIYALDPASGEACRAHIGSAIVSSPAIADGVVYVGSGDGHVYALDAATLAERWRFKTGDRVWSSPAVAGGVVYVGSNDQAVYALDAATGEERWRRETGSRVWASPAVAGETVVVGGSDRCLRALDAATGEVRWSVRTGDAIVSRPLIADGIVYATSLDGRLYALDLGSGGERWRSDAVGPLFGSPALTDGLVYAGSWDANVYALDAATGRECWRRATGGPVWSSPALAGEALCIGSDDGHLYALDPATGDERWRSATDGPVRTAVVVGDDRLWRSLGFFAQVGERLHVHAREARDMRRGLTIGARALPTAAEDWLPSGWHDGSVWAVPVGRESAVAVLEYATPDDAAAALSEAIARHRRDGWTDAPAPAPDGATCLGRITERGASAVCTAQRGPIVVVGMSALAPGNTVVSATNAADLGEIGRRAVIDATEGRR